jgi:tRNA dimethylallyltransferase
MRGRALSLSAPALLSLAVGNATAAASLAFSVPLRLPPAPHYRLRGGSCVLLPSSQSAAPPPLGAAARTMQAQAGAAGEAMPGSRIKVVVISGPTAVGKSALAESIAASLDGGAELISADSVQVYKGMDIGSAKPTREEQAAVRYHLLDIADPTDEYNAAEFATDAHQAAREVAARKALPIVVGGTGFYVQWLVFGRPGAPAATDEVAARAEATIESFSGDWASAIVAGREIDPVYCDTVLKDNDWFRLRRVFEVYYTSGQPLSSFERPQGKNMELHEVAAALRAAPFDFRCFFLYRSRLDIFKDIDRRCELMLQQGFVQECVSLVRHKKLRLGASAGPGSLGGERIAERAIGYRQVLDMLWKWREAQRGAAEAMTSEAQDAMLVDFLREFQSASRQFVKRQLSWFRSDPTFKWINAHDRQAAQAEVLRQVAMEECEFHDLYVDEDDSRRQASARGSESSKEEQRALKRYQTELTIFSTPERCVRAAAACAAGFSLQACALRACTLHADSRRHWAAAGEQVWRRRCTLLC